MEHLQAFDGFQANAGMRGCVMEGNLETLFLKFEKQMAVDRVRTRFTRRIWFPARSERPHRNGCAETEIGKEGIYLPCNFTLLRVGVVENRERKRAPFRPSDGTF